MITHIRYPKHEYEKLKELQFFWQVNLYSQCIYITLTFAEYKIKISRFMLVLTSKFLFTCCAYKLSSIELNPRWMKSWCQWVRWLHRPGELNKAKADGSSVMVDEKYLTQNQTLSHIELEAMHPNWKVDSLGHSESVQFFSVAMNRL